MIYSARAQPLFFSLNLLSGDVLSVSVVLFAKLPNDLIVLLAWKWMSSCHLVLHVNLFLLCFKRVFLTLFSVVFFPVDFEGCFSRTDYISLKRSRGLSKTQKICHCVSFDLISSYTINYVFVFAALPRRKSTKYLSKHVSKVCFLFRNSWFVFLT